VGAELESIINVSTVDVDSSLKPTPPLVSPPQRVPDRELQPQMRPSPLQRDVGHFDQARWQDLGGRTTRGPRKEALVVRRETEHDESRVPFLALFSSNYHR
jgi:hypothetical protein